jgi:hypothetical protein
VIFLGSVASTQSSDYFDSMKSCILHFATLEALAIYVKMEKPQGYIFNTVNNTLSAKLSPHELFKALNSYDAETSKQQEAA